MILGIGVDLVSTSRIKKIMEKHGCKFTQRVFSDKEISDSLKCRNEHAKVRHFAKRFAAKEAYVKARGLGFGRGIRTKDISVSNDHYGKPMISIAGENGLNHNIEISISDHGDYAIAFVTIHS